MARTYCSLSPSVCCRINSSASIVNIYFDYSNWWHRVHWTLHWSLECWAMHPESVGVGGKITNANGHECMKTVIAIAHLLPHSASIPLSDCDSCRAQRFAYTTIKCHHWTQTACCVKYSNVAVHVLTQTTLWVSWRKKIIDWKNFDPNSNFIAKFHNSPDVKRLSELFASEIAVKFGQNLNGSPTMCSIELLSKLMAINAAVAVDFNELHRTL